MYRLILPFLLSLVLLFACQGSQSGSSALTDWEPGRSNVPLNLTTVETSAPFIWWEGEKPSNTNFPPSDRHSFAPANANEAAVLSEGAWIGIDGKFDTQPFLEYQVTIPTSGRYFFYGRKFWQHGPFRWRWDDQPWQQVSRKVHLMDESPIRQFVAANWIGMGDVNLKAGSHTLRIELTDREGAAAFDCFALTRTPLQPRGNLKPNQRYQAEVSGGFLFDPETDPFAASAIDLRSLNEAVAGEQGFIQVKGESFVHAKNQQPVRFWAVNAGMGAIQMDRASMAYMARFLAKMGVNMVRLHGSIWSDDFRTIAPADLNQLFAFITAMKQEGIYTTLSIYFPLWLQFKPDSLFTGYNGQHPFALLFFNQDFQKIYYDWWRTLLTTPNPLTGKPLRDDPALAVVELVNEDSTLFWTFTPYENIPEPQTHLLEQQFGTWLATKYGSLDKALQAWATAKPAYKANQNQADQIRGDDPKAGRVGIVPLYEIFGQRDSLRAQDTASFLASLQRRFFQAAIAFLRQDLGYQATIHASNWVTANAQILGPLDKYSNTVADFMDRHGYFGGLHEGERAGYSLSPGDKFQDRSALLFSSQNPEQKHDFSLPIMDVRYNGLPSTITEINWPMPNRFRADFPLLTAAYGSLQETDGFFFFATDKPFWEESLGKFAISSPVTIGQFPATALIYRKGLLKPGESVAEVSLKISDIFALRGAPITAPQNLDEFRAKDIPPGQLLERDQVESIDPLAFLVGKVNLNFVDQAKPSQVRELSKFIDRKAKTVRSSTDELLWNYDRGSMTVNAPQVQGITGFLQRAGSVDLADVKFSSSMDYGTLLLVSLDDRPLAQSQRMLLQVMSEEQNFGWKTDGGKPKVIQSVGGAPIVVRNLAGEVTLKRADANRLTVTALDHRGYPSTKLGNAGKIQLRSDVFYYLIAP